MPNDKVTWKRKEGDGPVLSYTPPFSLDTIVWALNATVLRPVALLLIPLVAYTLQVRAGAVPGPLSRGYSTTAIGVAGLGGSTTGSVRELLSVEHVRNVFANLRASTTGALAAPWLRRLYRFALLLNVHRVLTRYVKNNGHYAKDPADWSRDVVVITGGSAGIGRAIVELLSHKHHAKIAVLDMAPPAYAPAPTRAPPILYIKADVTDAQAIADAAAQIRKTFGADPSILINNAGIPDGQRILDAHPDNVLRLFKVNTLSHYTTVKQFLPAMIQRGHGHVVSVASSASYMAVPQLSAYAVSKAGALAFHECLTGELRARYGPKARKIRTSVACPTKVRTALGDGLDDQGNQFVTPTLEPIQVAARIVQALEDGLSAHIIMPASMNVLPLISRGPAWLRRGLELVGQTDDSVNDKGVQRSKANGYGEHFEGEDRVLWERTINAINNAGATK